jgi:hypothetical protein
MTRENVIEGYNLIIISLKYLLKYFLCHKDNGVKYLHTFLGEKHDILWRKKNTTQILYLSTFQKLIFWLRKPTTSFVFIIKKKFLRPYQKKICFSVYLIRQNTLIDTFRSSFQQNNFSETIEYETFTWFPYNRKHITQFFLYQYIHSLQKS